MARQLVARAAAPAGRAGAGDPPVGRVPALIGDHKSPLRRPQSGDQVAGQLGMHRSPPGYLRWMLVVTKQGAQANSQLQPSPVKRRRQGVGSLAMRYLGVNLGPETFEDGGVVEPGVGSVGHPEEQLRVDMIDRTRITGAFRGFG
ncbi:MAG TPA: hypothetical protein VJS67_14145 [Pseudonocardiaceae bacterium]|nr:hypothetical protein [Pseudonocardiaceae bacterium]